MRLRAEALAAALLLASCVGPPQRERVAQRLLPPGEASDGFVKVGASYTAGGQRHTPRDDRDYDETGLASWYGEELRGNRTANGERFDPDGFTAAHRTLPMPSYVEVTSTETGRAILVRINDRGPFHGNRIIDLSLGAARQLGITGRGSHRVRVRRVEAGERDKMALRNGRAVLVRGGDRSRAAMPVVQRVPSGPGPYFLQVASFSSEQRARTLADKLDAEVSQIAGTWRVRLGPYKSADRAFAALAPLAARGYPDAVVTR